MTLRQKLLQVPSQLEESDLLLNLPPDRIGHGTFLHPEMGGSQSLVDKVLKNNIPLGKTYLIFLDFYSTSIWVLIPQLSVLVELCLTSNVKGQTVPSYSKHHFKYWYQLGHPSVICVRLKGFLSNISDMLVESQMTHNVEKTSSEIIFLFIVTFQTDDKGVFCTDLSHEYQLVASTFGLSREALWNLSQQAIDCIFAPETVKQQLKWRWTDLKHHIFTVTKPEANYVSQTVV